MNRINLCSAESLEIGIFLWKKNCQVFIFVLWADYIYGRKKKYPPIQCRPKNQIYSINACTNAIKFFFFHLFPIYFQWLAFIKWTQKHSPQYWFITPSFFYSIHNIIENTAWCTPTVDFGCCGSYGFDFDDDMVYNFKYNIRKKFVVFLKKKKKKKKPTPFRLDFSFWAVCYFFFFTKINFF